MFFGGVGKIVPLKWGLYRGMVGGVVVVKFLRKDEKFQIFYLYFVDYSSIIGIEFAYAHGLFYFTGLICTDWSPTMLRIKQGFCGFVSLFCGAALLAGMVVFGGGRAMAGPKGAVGDLYVTAYSDEVIQIDSETGEVVGVFINGNFIINPREVRFGPNGNLFSANVGYNINSPGSVSEHDGETGELIGDFASTGLDGRFRVNGLRFLPNGHLLVSTDVDIFEYDSRGQFAGTFATGLVTEHAPLDIGPDGLLYVSDIANHSIDRYELDGTFLGLFAVGDEDFRPEQHAFGPNGNLFVCSHETGSVLEFDGLTGAPLGTFIDTHLMYPTGIVFDLKGRIWVAGGGEVNEFDGETGVWIRSVAIQNSPIAITVKPVPSCLSLVVSDLNAGRNATWEVSSAIPGSHVVVAYGFEAGQTVVNDRMGFCATFGIGGVNENRIVDDGVADIAGTVSFVKIVPDGSAGLTILTQAAERGTCPDECVSNLVEQTIQ